MRVWKQWTEEHRTTPKTEGDYYERVNVLRIEGNLNSNRYVREGLQPKVFPFLQDIPGAIFQQDNACPHVAKTVSRVLFSQHIQLLPWAANSLDILQDVSRILQLQNTNFCRAYKQYGILFRQQTFKISLTPCHVLWQHLLQRVVATPNIDFEH
ncbi:uncharacterized protein TNCV_4925891 [Trichonephila clavipes]|nr:uncharacterized protein TNCV_4925891 [Trichonephila clavipes]